MRTRLEPPKQCQVRFILDFSAPWQVNSFLIFANQFFYTVTVFIFFLIFFGYAVPVSNFYELFNYAVTVFFAAMSVDTPQHVLSDTIGVENVTREMKVCSVCCLKRLQNGKISVGNRARSEECLVVQQWQDGGVLLGVG